MTENDQRAFDTVKKLFKNDYGDPFEMTPGQISLFRAIYEKQNPRLQFECYTQYGKSDIVSMAVLLRATTFPEKWPILGATKDKAGIIMGKLIKHIFENDYTLGKFQIGPDESLERVKREHSKEKVNFRIDDTGILGEVIVLSAEARRKGEDAGDILIGHGAPNLIEDDAALTPDKIHGKAMRMLGGHKDNFLLKITNTFGRNHAFRSSTNPHFKTIRIDYEQGIREGRINQEYIDEMRDLLDPVMFGILYQCKYPPADMIDEKGWMPLLSEEEIEEAQRRSVQAHGLRRLGADIAEGTNYNAFVIRQDNYARVKEKTLEKDLMKTADRINELIVEERITDTETFICATGVGAGVASRLIQLGLNINSVKTGESPTELTEEEKRLNPIEYFNLRAQLGWAGREWIRQGGALEPSVEWKQLSKMRYRIAAGKTIQIMSKEEMRLRGLISISESTDIPDAFFLTFFPRIIKIINNEASAPLKPYYPELGI